jgi:hypothetical protein
MAAEIQLNTGETEVLSDFANKTGLLMSGGGKLVLTNQRLLFCNRRKTKIHSEWELTDILYVGAGRNMNLFAFLFIIPLLMNSAVKASLKNGNSVRFVVSDKNKWITLINENRSKACRAVAVPSASN